MIPETHVLYESAKTIGLIKVHSGWEDVLQSMFPGHAIDVARKIKSTEVIVNRFANEKNTPTTRRLIVDAIRDSGVDIGDSFGCIPCSDDKNGMRVHFSVFYPDVRFHVGMLYRAEGVIE